MNDKKKKLKTQELSALELHELKRQERKTRYKPDTWRYLTEVNLTPDEYKEMFPTCLQDNVVLAVLQDDACLCYLCMDLLPGVAILHLYLPKENRNQKTIKIMQEMFYSHVHPWCKERAIDQILVNCAGDDLKTTELFRTFGFNPVNINLATMPVRSK